MTRFVILAGGEAKRLRWDTDVPKPCLDLGNGEFLLERQVNWLIGKMVSPKEIIVALNEKTLDYIEENDLKPVKGLTWFVEKEKLGTSGCVHDLMSKYTDDLFYVFNCDDILFGDYNPQSLLDIPISGVAQLLLGFGRFQFGVVHEVNGCVTGFEQKPLLKDKKVFIGHIAFNRNALRWLPAQDDFEPIVLPFLARQRLLYSKLFKGNWLTISTAKDLDEVRNYLGKKK